MFSKFTVLASLLFLVLTGCGGSTPSKPTSLLGTWKSDSPKMTAHISSGTIEIDLTGDGSSALYWKGSMPTKPSTDGTLVSIGDTSEMEYALLASQDSTKEFVYKDGKLSFSFSMLGVTQRVTLEK